MCGHVPPSTLSLDEDAFLAAEHPDFLSDPFCSPRCATSSPTQLGADDVSAPKLEKEQDCEPLEIRVLAAEDINQLVLKTLLLQFGIEPVIVENGKLAVEAWKKNEWDVILMDVQMPLMDGPMATRAIRLHETATGRRRTPIVALTANAMSH